MRKVKVSEDNVEDKWKDRIRVANPKWLGEKVEEKKKKKKINDHIIGYF